MVRKEQHFKNQNIEMWLENEIVHLRYNANSVLTLEMAKEIVEERLKICDGVSRPIFADYRAVLFLDAKTRNYLSEGDAVKLVKAGAFLIDHPITKLLGNIFTKVNRPPLPSKFFTDEKKALKWLESYK